MARLIAVLFKIVENSKYYKLGVEKSCKAPGTRILNYVSCNFWRIESDQKGTTAPLPLAPFFSKFFYQNFQVSEISSRLVAYLVAVQVVRGSLKLIGGYLPLTPFPWNTSDANLTVDFFVQNSLKFKLLQNRGWEILHSTRDKNRNLSKL